MAEPHSKLQHHHAHKNMYSTRESVARVATPIMTKANSLILRLKLLSYCN